jgi:hypothetical protein
LTLVRLRERLFGSPRRRIDMRLLRVLVIAVLVASELVHAPVASAATSFAATLNGQNEIPQNSGDPNGTGTASLVLKRKKRSLCWTITYDKIDAPTAGHIHKANGPGAEGPIFVYLFLTTQASGASDCSFISRKDARDLTEDTANRFYVNLHNATYPDGAIRGQLVVQ